MKSAHKKKSRNEKNRTSEKKESGNFFLDKVKVNVCCTGQRGIFKWDFFSLHLLFKLGRLQFDESGEKTLGPQFFFSLFSLTKYTKILFSLLFYFFPSFLKSTQPNKLVLKSHLFLSINGILE